VDEGTCCGFCRGVEVQQDCILVIFSRPSGGGLSLDSTQDYVLGYFQTSPVRQAQGRLYWTECRVLTQTQRPLPENVAPFRWTDSSSHC
jgi:hypothetical protein